MVTDKRISLTVREKIECYITIQTNITLMCLYMYTAILTVLNNTLTEARDKMFSDCQVNNVLQWTGLVQQTKRRNRN